ncbi:MAG: thioredoxin family protein [Bacteroidetes bacterium]|nr:thioredoxin family protein [Bacteroidota bacterium]MBS1932371.1 thioredoxin family protein [Bacteroidota bacterium]
MKRALLILCLFLFVTVAINAQTTATKIYDPNANADSDIAAAIKKAKAENKYVLLQAGGNWCSWCIEFNRFEHADSSIDSLLNKCFVIYHLNYSKENENKSIFAKYGYPQRFGFPVFIILDGSGNRLHTQNSEYLEQGRSYNKQKVYEFLLNWTPQALTPALYN